MVYMGLGGGSKKERKQERGKGGGVWVRVSMSRTAVGSSPGQCRQSNYLSLPPPPLDSHSLTHSPPPSPSHSLANEFSSQHYPRLLVSYRIILYHIVLYRFLSFLIIYHIIIFLKELPSYYSVVLYYIIYYIILYYIIYFLSRFMDSPWIEDWRHRFCDIKRS